MISTPIILSLYGIQDYFRIINKMSKSYFALYPVQFPIFLTLMVMSFFLYKQCRERQAFNVFTYFYIGILILYILLPKGATYSSTNFSIYAFHLMYSGIPYTFSILIGFLISYFFYYKNKSFTISKTKYTWLTLPAMLLLIELTYLLTKTPITQYFSLRGVHSYSSDSNFIFMSNILLKSAPMLLAVFLCSLFISLYKWSSLKHSLILALASCLFVIIFPTGDSFSTPSTLAYTLSYIINYFAPATIASLAGYLLVKSTGLSFSSNTELNQEPVQNDSLLLGKRAFLSGDYASAIKYLRAAKTHQELDTTGASFYKQALSRHNK